MRTPVAGLALALLAFAPIACSGDAGSAGTAAPTTETAQHYGATPSPDADVTYQPDVVLLEGGASAIRSASSDGTTWTIDGDADGADEIALGAVLYATSLAVGRVVFLERDGSGDLVVTLAPVELGEVIRDGRIRVRRALDLDASPMRSIPDAPGSVSELDDAPVESALRPVSGTEELRIVNIARHRPSAARPQVVPMPPPFTEGSSAWAAGGWSGTVTRSSGDVALHVEHAGEDLESIVDVGFHFVTPSLDADIGIIDGEVGDAAIELRGLRELTLDLQAGSVGGLGSNLNQKIEVPVSLNEPIIVGGIALNLNVTFKFLVQTAFTARNSTIAAHGAWTSDGPLSFDRTSGTVSVVTPTITPKADILESLKGISVGVNGIVFATEMRVMLGLGVPAANAGPYARVITSVGLTVGSDLGFAGRAMKCHQATVTVTGAFGAGLALSESVADALNQLFQRLGSAHEIEEENLGDLVSEKLYSTAFWTPDTDYCRLNG